MTDFENEGTPQAEADAQAPVQEDATASAPVETVESADAPEAEEQTVSFTPEQQQKVDEIVGKKVAKQHEMQREYDRERAELLEQVQSLQSKIPDPVAPEVPEMPDPEEAYLDPEGYKKKVIDWNKAQLERQKFDAEQQARNTARENAERLKQEEQARKVQQVQTAYLDKAQELGIDQQTAVQQGQIVESLLPPHLQTLSTELVQDANGPAVVNYLVKNPIEMERMQGMTLSQAILSIENTIKPKLQGARKSSQAPKPLDVSHGAGAPVKKRGPQGATFE